MLSSRLLRAAAGGSPTHDDEERGQPEQEARRGQVVVMGCVAGAASGDVSGSTRVVCQRVVIGLGVRAWRRIVATLTVRLDAGVRQGAIDAGRCIGR